jgi:hypothetical protein
MHETHDFTRIRRKLRNTGIFRRHLKVLAGPNRRPVGNWLVEKR